MAICTFTAGRRPSSIYFASCPRSTRSSLASRRFLDNSRMPLIWRAVTEPSVIIFIAWSRARSERQSECATKRKSAPGRSRCQPSRLELAKQIFGEMSGHTVVLVGTGDMGELVARLLQQSGARLIIVGRNAERVGELQNRYRAEGRQFEALESSLSEADVVVTSTSSPSAIVGSALVKKVMRKRRGRDLFFVDVAVPRDVNPDVDSLDGVYRYDVDDLAAVVARSRGSREKEAELAESIVQEEVARFERWAEAEQVTPLVRTLRQHFQKTLHKELGRSLRSRLKHLGDSERMHLERMIDAAVNKLMHDPTMQLRKWASQSPDDLEQATALARRDVRALQGERRQEFGLGRRHGTERELVHRIDW